MFYWYDLITILPPIFVDLKYKEKIFKYSTTTCPATNPKLNHATKTTTNARYFRMLQAGNKNSNNFFSKLSCKCCQIVPWYLKTGYFLKFEWVKQKHIASFVGQIYKSQQSQNSRAALIFLYNLILTSNKMKRSVNYVLTLKAFS